MTSPNIKVTPADLQAMATHLDDAAHWVKDTAGRMGDKWNPQAWGYLLGQLFGMPAHTEIDRLEALCATRARVMAGDADELRAIVAKYVNTDLDNADTFTGTP
ncbi:hypothetical protein [Actinokineospora cianjurensis]|uniref:Excreted virulence factor EspC (Type VII ESX diderm) n=1 Tax=Actinokineospora cianjurensis TaxID=585224 RepID=A0A421AVG4_9PSEU|nr:hypothetical protein [Actinokineospora cianjurensis]RLK54018.1 hypothetical protein CLV68_6019 [Actinokineospora cianjurensis]